MRGRAGLIETAESLRAYALFASVPYAAMWSRALLVEGREPAAALLIAAHGLGVMTVALVSDRADLERDGVRGVALWRFPTGEREGANAAWLPALVVLTALVFGGLIASAPALGWCATALLLIGLWHATRARAKKYAMVEALAPAAALLAPMAVVGVLAHGTLTPAAVGATTLGSVLLGLALLLCVVRDQPLDATRGWATTATRLGRRRACALAWMWIVAAVVLSAMGAAWGWRGWIVSAAVALAAAASGQAFARAAYERLVAVWTTTLWAVSAAFLLGA